MTQITTLIDYGKTTAKEILENRLLGRSEVTRKSTKKSDLPKMSKKQKKKKTKKRRKIEHLYV